MTGYGRPGVYITESYQPLTSIAAVPGGSIPAIAAVHPRGPVTPQLISNWAEFTTLYGSYADAPSSFLPLAVNDFFANGGSQLFVLRCANSDATASTLALEDIAATVNGALVLTASSPGVWGQQVAVTVSTTTGSNGASYFTLQVYLTSGGTQTLKETFPFLSMNPADSRFCVPILNSQNGSKYVYVTDEITTYVAGQNDLTAVSSPASLTGGTDGTSAPVLGTLVPAQLDTIQNQAMAVNLPGVSDAVTLNDLLAWAATDGDKVIVCDGPAPIAATLNSTGYPASVVSEYLALVQSGSPALSASSFGAVYGPWRLTQNPASSVNGATIWLPPGPAVLAKFQANDIAAGPYQSPAGVNYSVSALAMEASFSKSQLDTLNNANVNVIRQVPVPGGGAAFCIMGARTLATGYPDKFLAIRREMIALEHDMTNLLSFALFEPNGPNLWSQIESVLNNYLQQQFQSGVFAGDTAADSFQVICDTTNNTPQTAQAGLVTVTVLVALTSPAEFIQLNLTQTTSTALTPASS